MNMATEDARKLFVAGLPESISEDVLRQLFEATGGSVVEVSLPRDRNTGRPRGFGFVTFSSAEEASSARASLDGSLQAGRAISVRPFSSEPPRRGERAETRQESSGPPPGDRTLYVGNLPYDATQQEIVQFLSESGVDSVVRVHLPSNPDGRLRGFGFVTLSSAEAATEAVQNLRSVELRGRRLMISIAHPRGERPTGGPPGERADRPRPRQDSFAEPRHLPAEMPPPQAFGGRPVEGRRARAPAPSGGDGEEGKKRKKRRGPSGERPAEAPKRGRAGHWRDWNDEWDDDE
jgi:nucleolin